jgi:hypothetical protein
MEMWMTHETVSVVDLLQVQEVGGTCCFYKCCKDTHSLLHEYVHN